ncbi:MAG: DUF86 domain-containing protein [Bacteroidota bacterium]
MLKQRDDIRILDIEECIRRIELFVLDLDYDNFMYDIKTQDAVVRNLEIIGEAVKSLTPEFTEKHKHISWSEIGRLRDKLIHHYSGINYDIVWAIIQKDIPQLKSDISLI